MIANMTATSILKCSKHSCSTFPISSIEKESTNFKKMLPSSKKPWI